MRIMAWLPAAALFLTLPVAAVRAEGVAGSTLTLAGTCTPPSFGDAAYACATDAAVMLAIHPTGAATLIEFPLADGGSLRFGGPRPQAEGNRAVFPVTRIRLVERAGAEPRLREATGSCAVTWNHEGYAVACQTAGADGETHGASLRGNGIPEVRR